MTIPILLAGINGINVENKIRELSYSRSGVSGPLVLVGVLFLVALLFFFAAIISRTQQHRRHSHHYHSKPAPNMDVNNAHGKNFFLPLPYRHRRRSGVFPLNPTLAEIGGLPPIRANARSPFVARG
jgi:hypothetical protein